MKEDKSGSGGERTYAAHLTLPATKKRWWDEIHLRIGRYYNVVFQNNRAMLDATGRSNAELSRFLCAHGYDISGQVISHYTLHPDVRTHSMATLISIEMYWNIPLTVLMSEDLSVLSKQEIREFIRMFNPS